MEKLQLIPKNEVIIKQTSNQKYPPLFYLVTSCILPYKKGIIKNPKFYTTSHNPMLVPTTFFSTTFGIAIQTKVYHKDIAIPISEIGNIQI